MSIVVRKEGILNTVQDLGRTGYRKLGINTNGVMDIAAARLINTLLGNPDGAAVLELHFPAGEFHFERSTMFALGGADMGTSLNGANAPNWRIHQAEAGSTLKFLGKVSGERTYLAVRGGLDVNQWLGSRSTNLSVAAGGIEGRRLRRGDRIPIFPASELSAPFGFLISRSLIPLYSDYPTVRIVPGAEFPTLTNESQQSLAEQTFVISHESNRMGYRLEGDGLDRKNRGEVLSSAVSFGTIQLLPSGQLIVLMADHQTTGGYPRIAHVLSADLPLLAQLGEGKKVAFHPVSIEDAERAALEFDQGLRQLRLALELRQPGSRDI